MAKWSTQHTLNTGLIVIGLLAILSSGASLFASKVLVQDMAALAVQEVRDLAGGQTLRLICFREVSDASAALLTGDEQYVRAARAGSAAVREQMARMERQIVDREGRFHVERVRVAEREYLEAFEHALGAPGGQQKLMATAAAGSRGVTLERALDAFVVHMEPAAVGGLSATRTSVGRTQTIFNMITSVSIVLMLVLCGMLIVVINRSQREQTSERILAEEGRTERRVVVGEHTTVAVRERRPARRGDDEVLEPGDLPLAAVDPARDDGRRPRREVGPCLRCGRAHGSLLRLVARRVRLTRRF